LFVFDVFVVVFLGGLFFEMPLLPPLSSGEEINLSNNNHH
jgi:hypothetical protein